MNIHQHAGYFHRLRAHCLLCALNVDRVIGDKPVDHVKLVPAFAVQFDDQTVVHFTEETGSKGLSMAISPSSGHFANQPVLIDGALGQYCKSF